ncbi:protein lethal(2)essential for life-like isoform X2 [Anopheles merus]|uniref:protein lethal(2)essential for life-like isoform X2 n=1 Tax=Anopheles merus TaxID=30066 RepID=UPI001BE3E464|nr:protein lethal(2)essential for life-like isoform X2 [Anopheles merus]
MSIIPIFFRNWWDDEWDRPLWSSRLLDQHFGSGVTADDLLNALASVTDRRLQEQQAQQGQQSGNRYNRPWHSSCVARMHDSGSAVNISKDKFQINLDVQQFSPEEISVKYVDNCVLVEGKHEEKQDDHGYVSRHFVRRYMLPKGHNEADIVSSLSSDGILTITCPRKEIEQKKEERSIPITHTGQPMKQVTGKAAQENEKKEKKDTQNHRKQSGRMLWHSECVSKQRDSNSLIGTSGPLPLADRLQINLDVQQFTPHEITVKTVNNSIVVEGKHEEKQDEHGFIARHFVRRYVLPDDHDPKDVISSLSSDGVLTIVAPKKVPQPAPEAVYERTVPIQRIEERTVESVRTTSESVTSESNGK